MDQKSSKTNSYIDSRVKTAIVCLPILFYMLSNKILLTILLISTYSFPKYKNK